MSAGLKRRSGPDGAANANNSRDVLRFRLAAAANNNYPWRLLGGLVYEGILVEPVGDVAVEGARFHRHAVHPGEGAIRDVEGLQHAETWRDTKAS